MPPRGCAAGTWHSSWRTYADLDDFGTANDVFIRVGVDLGEQAIRGALDKAGLNPEDVDLVVSTSVTGIADRRWRHAWCRGWDCARTSSACRSSASVRGRGGGDRPGP